MTLGQIFIRLRQLFIASFIGSDSRLRSGWRFLVFAAAYIFSTLVIGGTGNAILYSLQFSPTTSASVFFVANSLFALIPALLIGWLCGKYLEGLPFRALGAWFTQGWLLNLAAGIVLGAGTLGIAILISSVFGGLRFEFNHEVGSDAILRTMAASLAVFAVAAAFEEALFRGYMLQTFARSGLAWLAILLTSVFFGVAHLDNPSVGKISSLNTAIAGIWFGIAYLKTRDLWFVWGLHLMWNWMQGAVFGIEVSGLTEIVSSPLLKEIDSGPAWLTGGSYGIEGGIASTIALIVSTVAIYFLPVLKPNDEMLALTSKAEPPA